MSTSASTQIEKLIAPVAAKYEVLPEHWIHGWDEGLSFCFDCATKKVAELLEEEPDGGYLVDGGWGSEGDSEASCETCQAALDNSFTTDAAEQALDYFEEHGFDETDPGDCYVLTKTIAAEGCDDSELNTRIEQLCSKILSERKVTP